MKKVLIMLLIALTITLSGCSKIYVRQEKIIKDIEYECSTYWFSTYCDTIFYFEDGTSLEKDKYITKYNIGDEFFILVEKE